MRSILFLLFISFLANQTTSIEIHGKFSGYYYKIPNSEISSSKQYFVCIIEDNIFSNQSNQNNVVLNTCKNDKKNSKVELVDFFNGTVQLIPNVIFKTFKKLEHLVVSEGRGLKKLESEFFEYAENLKIISITGNLLKELEGEVFKNATNLEIIDLQSNLLEIIHENAFVGLPKLQRLYLSGNQLQVLDFDVFSNLHLNELDLQNNPCFNKIFTKMNGSLVDVENELAMECVKVTTASIEYDYSEIDASSQNLDVRSYLPQNAQESDNSKFKELSEMVERTNEKLANVQDDLKAMEKNNQKKFDQILTKLNGLALNKFFHV